MSTLSPLSREQGSRQQHRTSFLYADTPAHTEHTQAPRDRHRTQPGRHTHISTRSLQALPRTPSTATPRLSAHAAPQAQHSDWLPRPCARARRGRMSGDPYRSILVNILVLRLLQCCHSGRGRGGGGGCRCCYCSCRSSGCRLSEISRWPGVRRDAHACGGTGTPRVTAGRRRMEELDTATACASR